MPTVIRLAPKSPNVSRIQEVSFEDAFGEHSEAHGKLLKKIAAKAKAAKPFKKIAAKVKAKVSSVKAKVAERKAAKKAASEDQPEEDQPQDDASQDVAPDDPSSDNTSDDSGSGEETQSAEGKQVQRHNHKIIPMENATIIRLAPNQQLQRVTTFEEAFGAHSNLFGSLRAKWAKKRAANQHIIQQAKREINDEKTETKVNKQRNKARKRVARVEKRGAVQQARIKKRTNAQQGRIAKRTQAKAARQAKRALGKDDPSASTDDTSQDDATTDDNSTDNGSTDDTGSTDDGSQDLASNDSGSDDSSSPDEDTETSNDGDTDYGGGDDTGADDGGGTESDDGYTDTFDGSNGDYDSFDGDETKLAPDDFYDYKEGDGQTLKARIHPKVKEAAVKSEWNKECVCQLQSQFDNLESSFDGSEESEAQAEFLAGQIEKRRQRAMMFDGQMDDYMNAAGPRKGRRMAEVMGAKREARKQRVGVRRGMQNAASSRGNNITEVEQGLNPELSNNRIDVPATSSMCGADGYKTGITALDSKNDFDAPHAIDIKLGFDASKTKAEAQSIIKSVNWKAVGITAVVTIALVVVVSKLSK